MLWLSVVLVGAGYSQISRTAELGGIQVTMALDNTSPMVGEPITFLITLENVSPAPALNISANFQLSEGNGLKIMVQGPGELAERYDGHLEPGVYSAVPVPLVKGEPKTVETLLYFDRTNPSGLLFPKAGRYELSAEWEFVASINSEPVKLEFPTEVITVREATGDAAAALEMLGRPEFILGAHFGIVPNIDLLNGMTEGALRYPKTKIGAIMLRACGLTHLRSPDTSHYETGAELLRQYLDNGVGMTGVDTVAWEMAAAYHKLGQYDVARQWAFYFVRNCAESTRLRVEDTLLKFYYLDPREFASNSPWYVLQTPIMMPGELPPTDLRPKEAE